MQIEGQDVAEAAVVAASTAPAAPAAETPEPGSIEAELATLQAQQAEIDNAALKALETGEATPAATAPAAAANPADPSTPKVDAGAVIPPAAAKTKQDPKDAAIIALRRRNREIELELAHANGEKRVLEQLAAGAVNTAAAAPVVETPKDRLANIDEQLIAIAQQNETGDLSMPDYERQRLALMDTRDDIRAEMRAPAPALAAPAATTDPVITDTAVQDHLSKLFVDHPYIQTMTRDQLDPFHAEAVRQMQAAGTFGQGNRADMELRSRMADLVRADMFSKMGVPDPRKTAQPATATPAISPTAAAREAKLELAGNHPPDISKVGSPVTGAALTPATAMATLQSFAGNEDAAIAWMNQHPELMNMK